MYVKKSARRFFDIANSQALSRPFWQVKVEFEIMTSFIVIRKQVFVSFSC